VSQVSRGKKKGYELLVVSMIWKPKSAFDKDILEVRTQGEVQQALALLAENGPFLGCELAEEEDIGNSLRKCVYIAKFERTATRWTFILYRPHDEWKIFNARYKNIQVDFAQSQSTGSL
jgi:hypothetical protein